LRGIEFLAPVVRKRTPRPVIVIVIIWPADLGDSELSGRVGDGFAGCGVTRLPVTGQSARPG
jgi:hypothetical protein